MRKVQVQVTVIDVDLKKDVITGIPCLIYYILIYFILLILVVYF